MALLKSLLLASLSVSCALGVTRLAVSADGKGFEYGGKRVFLSGANQPWINYGQDFGNNQTNGVACALQQAIANVSAAGGNTVRMWLFVEGDSIPVFDPAASGRVVAPDRTGSLARDLKAYLRYAASQNVFVNLVLWNGAVLKNQAAIDLIVDAAGDRVASLVDNVLAPLAAALKDEPALGAWELMNEPEGSLTLVTDATEPCFDTQTALGNTGAGWAGHSYTMAQALRFFALQAEAIHRADPQALVTVGAWSEHSVTSAFPATGGQGFFNYYSDDCLAKAKALRGGRRHSSSSNSSSSSSSSSSSTTMGTSCPDVPPAPGAYSCAQQASWGKCDVAANPWMIGFCCSTCFHCAAGCGAPSAPTPPPAPPTPAPPTPAPAPTPLGAARLDFYQVHSYPEAPPGSAALNKSKPMSPFMRRAAEYALDKPLVIGEFAAAKAGCPNADLYTYAYDAESGGYAGAWDWAILGGDPTAAAIYTGIAALKGKAGIAVDITGGVPPVDTCSCSDVAPDAQYTCAQQASWGKCGEDFMRGLCCRSCHACQGCK